MLVCPAEEIAELTGEWNPKVDDPNYRDEALLMGNYLHSYFESPEAHQAFIHEHPEIMNSRAKTPTLKSAYKKICDPMIEALASDNSFEQLYQGGKEQIVSGELFGHAWKGKIDCLNLEHGYFVDLKTTQDLHKRFWCDDHWGSFVEAYNYPLQMWVYKQLIKQTFGVDCQPFIVAVTKNAVPDKQIIQIEDYHMQDAQLQLEDNIEPITKMLNGEIKATHCGVCSYCRKFKELSSVIGSDDLIN